VDEVSGTAVRSVRAAIRAVVARPGSVRRLTLRVRRGDDRRPVELLLHGLPGVGTAGLVVGIARDIGERIEAAERMRRLVVAQHARAAELGAVIRAIGEGLVVIAPDGRIRLVNPAAERLLPGLEAATWSDLVGRLEGGAEALPVDPAPGPPVELRRRGADECWLEVAAYPIPLAQGSAVDDAGTIVVVRDVTEAHRRALVRDTFLGVLSHELRTPVTTIYGAAALLARERGAAASGRDELLDDIVEESERLQRIVENVIALTRFGDAPGDLGREPVLLQRILPAALRGERARWPGVAFELDLPPGMPTVAADPAYLEQVVRNLLGNAAKYAGAGGPIRIEVRPRGQEVVVAVLDRGPGLVAEEASRVFDLYYRSEATASQAPGAGIGLFVCARLIEAMDGRIWGRPRAGGGAEFGFALQVMGDD
jgi:signal transduction histidine kinase